MCAIRIDYDSLRLLFINVYMSYEGNDRMTDEFADKLEIMDSIISSNLDCHIIAGGDFNVDLSRSWAHTAMLNSFCCNTDLNFALRNDKCKVDYTYSFNICRFNVLDHYLLSDTLYSISVDSVLSLYDIDNLSDHEPLVLQLSLDVHCVGFRYRIYAPRDYVGEDYRR